MYYPYFIFQTKKLQEKYKNFFFLSQYIIYLWLVQSFEFPDFQLELCVLKPKLLVLISKIFHLLLSHFIKICSKWQNSTESANYFLLILWTNHPFTEKISFYIHELKHFSIPMTTGGREIINKNLLFLLLYLK